MLLRPIQPRVYTSTLETLFGDLWKDWKQWNSSENSRIESAVEPQISHFANFTPWKELELIRHFWKMWNSRMVNFHNLGGGLTSVLTFHIFLIFNCEELVRIRVICEGLIRFFSDVKNWYAIFTNICMKFLVYTLSFCMPSQISWYLYRGLK